MKRMVTQLGRVSVSALEEFGYAFMLLVESLSWILLGRFRQQPVRLNQIAQEIINIGIRAIPIVSVLCFAVGAMLAIQGLETLRDYGAQMQVVVGIAVSVTREFSALIVGILVAGRSASAIAARIGTMHESQEIDALRVIGIDPVRYLAAPVLIAMLISVPALTILGDAVAMLGGGVYTALELGMPLGVYMERSFQALVVWDVMQGLIKSVLFAVIIVVIGMINGFQVHGGAEGVGRATTRAVVLSISGIVIADMIFTFFLTRAL